MSAPPSSPSRPRPAKPPSARPLTLLDCVATAASNNDGGASSRARILEQQREVMLRRRQEALRADVVRSVDDPGAPSQPPHYSTPAIPQFSAPRPEDADPTSTFSSTGGDAGGGTGTATLSSTLSSTASSTAPLNPTQVTEAKRAPSASSLSIPPPRGAAGAGGAGAGKPRSSAAAAFRAKAYRRVSRSSGEEQGGGADGGGRQLSLSGDEERARDGAFLADGSGGGGGSAPSARPPAKPDRRRKEEEAQEGGSKGKRRGGTGSGSGSSTTELAVALAADGTARGFDLEGLLSRSSGVARFVTAPCPREAGVVQCYIKRVKKGGCARVCWNDGKMAACRQTGMIYVLDLPTHQTFKNAGPTGKLAPEYYLYAKKGDRFLLAAKRRAHNATSNYAITRSGTDFGKESGAYLGKLRANFVGTEFQVGRCAWG